jgi:hypothetical protein
MLYTFRPGGDGAEVGQGHLEGTLQALLQLFWSQTCPRLSRLCSVLGPDSYLTFQWGNTAKR